MKHLPKINPIGNVESLGGSVVFEERHGMQRLLAQTHEIRSDTVVDHALFGDFREVFGNLENAISRRDYQAHHTGAVERSIDEMTLEHARRQVERLQEVALSSR